jgi:3-oxoacyl-ACP reductase-like protein
MSVLGEITSRVFGQQNAAPAAPSAPSAPATPSAPAAPSAQPAQPAPDRARAEQVLEQLAAQNPQKLDWRHSIVDLMKLLGLDSSFEARKELAQELNYSGSTSDSAAMNIWLHKQVMAKLAANGGKLPPEIKH